MADLEQLRAVARETVTETFLALGVDMRKPGEIIEVQQDFAFNRAARLTVRKLRMHAMTAVITTASGGVLYALWQYILAARAAGH